MKDVGGTFIAYFVVILLVCLGSCRGCLVSSDVAVSAADKMGFSDIEVVDHAWVFVGWRGCSKTDAARFTVRATNPAGKRVTIIVCSGWLFKDSTIRTE